ncbi:ParE family toxin-like protein [Chthoniobacter flavus]
MHFKKLEGHESLWSVRIGRQYRALGHRKGEHMVWVWIGHHSEYDRLTR